MVNLIKFSFLLLVYFSQLFHLCIAQSITKTVETVKNIKRRELTLNQNLDVVREDYFSKENKKIIVTIEYEKPNIIRSIIGYVDYPSIAYKIDFSNGTYFDLEDGVELRFKDNFEFNGLQKGKNITINYINGKKNGELTQTNGSSANKELLLNFKNGKLNGTQKSFYGDASIKIDGYFTNNKLIHYNSFSNTGSIISKLKTTNGISTTPQLLNGTVLKRENSYVFWHPDLMNTGDIYYDSKLNPGEGSNYQSSKKYLYDTEGYGGRDVRNYIGINYYSRNKPYTLEYKDKFDSDKNTFSNPYVIKCLLNIPDFKIREYQFSEEEDKKIIPLSVKFNDIDTVNVFQKSEFILNDNFYFDFSEHRFYEYKGGSTKLFLIPKDFIKDEYLDWSLINYLNELDNNLGEWLINTFDINNLFYLAPTAGMDAYPIYLYDSSSIFKFLNVFVETMLFNIDEIKKGAPSYISHSYIKNPFVGVAAGYNDNHYRYFNFHKYGNSITIMNKDQVRYFKLYNKNKADYFDGNCFYSFSFKEGSFGVFNIENIDINCLNINTAGFKENNDTIKLRLQDDNYVFTDVDVEADYPRGFNWRSYMSRAIERSIDELAEDGNSVGTIKVKFIVDKEGNISNIESLNMKGTVLERLVIDAIIKSPKFMPAILYGKQVKSWKVIEVSYLKP